MNTSEGLILVSDLHVEGNNIQHCLQVLETVHKLAKTHGWRVGMLGDFWNSVCTKGTLPVDVLNVMLRFFHTRWEVDTIFIPGNHDYFDASETEHGLTPFKFINPHIRVIDKPTVVRGNELWIPFIRNTDTLRDVLTTEGVSVVFGHFDVKGAQLAGTRLATHGVVLGDFPNVPVYSGHLHKPHRHGDGKNWVQYVGTPRPVTFAEHDQQKMLFVLDTSTWEVSQTIPISIGPQMYDIKACELDGFLDILKPLDRIRLSSEPRSEQLVQLKAKGVTFEISKNTVVPARVLHTNSMCPQELFREFVNHRHPSSNEALASIHRRALATGIEWLQTNSHLQTVSGSAVDVVFEKISIRNVGPFRAVELSLQDVGLTLVTGQRGGSRDASNGAGKSFLTLGCILWVCTGFTPGSNFTSTTGAGLIHIGQKDCEVKLYGKVNGKTWCISRSLVMGKGGKVTTSLNLSVDTKRCTSASIAGTQKLIAHTVFGLPAKSTGKDLKNWLYRNMLWEQIQEGQWVDLKDSSGKQVIHEFCQLYKCGRLWECAFEWAKRLKSDSTKEENTLKGSFALLECSKGRLIANLEYAKGGQETWEDERSKRKQVLRGEYHTLQQKLQRHGSNLVGDGDTIMIEDIEEIGSQYNATRESITDISGEVGRMKYQKELLNPVAPTIFKPLPQPIPEGTLAQLESKLRNRRADMAQCRSDIARDVREIRQSEKDMQCNTCGRAFDNAAQLKHQTKVIEHRLNTNRTSLMVHQENIAKQNGMINDCQTQRASYLAYVNRLEYDRLTIEEDRLNRSIQDLQGHLTDLQFRRDKALLAKANQNNREGMLKRLSQISSALKKLEFEVCPHIKEVKRVEDELKKIGTEIVTNGSLTRAVRERFLMYEFLMDWFGPKGIPTYVIERQLYALAERTTYWLEHLFDTKDISINYTIGPEGTLLKNLEGGCIRGVLSGGQHRRVQLASFLAWIDLSPTKLSLVVLDEACTFMDIHGVRQVLASLNRWRTSGGSDKCCFFISHDSSQHRDTSMYSKHLHIEHRGEVSRLSTERTTNQTNKRARLI